MDQILILLIISGFISYSAWIFSTINTNKIGTQIASGAMFIIVLLLLWRVFQLNLDFGLVLSIATLFAGLSWIMGLILKLKSLISESGSYFWILLVILCIRSFAYEPYQIPSSSMEPGLQVGDFVLVNKFAYGIRLPAINKLVSKGKEPKRGEVAVFLPPHTLCDSTPEEARPELSSMSIRDSQIFLSRFLSLQESRCTTLGIKYIKRVIGLPGDRIEIKGYELFINGNKVKQELLDKSSEESFYLETIDDIDHIVRILGISEYENFVWDVPPNKYLVIGDNRDNSLDSRAWGYFSKENLIGRGEFIWLHWGSFTELPHFQRNQRIQ
ncbi:MAG TPA: signal peptidase I [Gammaproteobacteria bacterium]|nr:signal peptidase I [Gammaproteobacteria bacterium]